MVDFVIAGTQKGGTTALHSYLSDHPEICMADPKEVHFFDDDRNFSSGSPEYSKYHAFFSPENTHRLLGEATPSYMYWREAPKRLWEYNPKMKIIILLRNPIERAYSHWNMQRSRKTDQSTFWQAVNNEKTTCDRALLKQNRVFSYVDRGFYMEQLRRLWAYFPKDRVLV